MFSTSFNNNLISLAYTCENHNQCKMKGMNGVKPTNGLKDIANAETMNDLKDISYNNIQNQRNGIKKIKTIEVRKEEVLAIRSRFPTKIPIIVHRFYKESHLPQLEKAKFLVPQELTMSQFQTIIRNRMKMNPNQALYLLVNDRSMLSLSLTLAEVYSEYACADGFLYITYASQEVFGSYKEHYQSKNTKSIQLQTSLHSRRKQRNLYENYPHVKKWII